MARSLGIRWSQLRLGLIVSTVAVVASVLIFFIDEFVQLTEERYTLYFYTFTTHTLQPRAPVWLAGHRAGAVRTIDFLPPAGESRERLRIALSLQRDVQPLIREGSAARVITSGIVGETVVNIIPSGEGEPMPSDGILPTEAELDPVEVIRSFKTLSESLQPALESWSNVYQRATRGPGTIARFRQDPKELYQFQDRLGELAELAHQVETARGGVARVLTEEQSRAVIASLGPRLRRLRTLYRDSELRRLLQDETALARLDSIAVRAGRLEGNLQGAEGSIGRLMHDPALSEEIERTLTMLRDLREAFRALRGTAGGATPGQ